MSEDFSPLRLLVGTKSKLGIALQKRIFPFLLQTYEFIHFQSNHNLKFVKQRVAFRQITFEK